MFFRFTFSHVSGHTACHDRNFNCLDDAKAWVRYCFQAWSYIQSITLHQYLTDDSCDTIQFIGTFILDGDKVINRETKEAI